MSQLHSTELKKLLAKMFGGTEDHPAAKAARNKGPASPVREIEAADVQFVDNPQDFDERLDRLLARDGSPTGFVGGTVHLLNFEKVREKLGDRWAGVCSRVHQIVRGMLKNRLSPHDFFTLYQDDTYVIVFGGCSAEDAKFKCALLAEEIMEKVLGEDEAGHIELLDVKAIVSEVDGGIGTEKVTKIEALAGVLRQANANPSDSSTSDHWPDPNQDRALTPDEVASLLGMAETQIQAYECREESVGDPAIEANRLRELIRQLRNFERALAAVDARSSNAETRCTRTEPNVERQERQASARNIINQLTERAEKQLARRQGELPWVYEDEQDTEQSLSVTFSYLPIWHVSKQTIGAHLCQLSLEHKSKQISYLSILKDDIDIELANMIDKILCRKANEDLKESALEDGMNIISVPVHYSTLAKLGSQREFQMLCRHIPRELRGLWLWEIVKAPIDSWRSHLPPAVATVKPFGRMIFVRVDLFRTDFSDVMRNLRHLRSAGVHAVGLDLNDLSAPESVLIELLERFSDGTREHGLKCYAHGLTSMSLITAAVCAGYDHLSGQAIAEPVDSLQGIQPTPVQTMYLKRSSNIG